MCLFCLNWRDQRERERERRDLGPLERKNKSLERETNKWGCRLKTDPGKMAGNR